MMGSQAPRVSDFLDELTTNDTLATQWGSADRAERREILKQRGFSGRDLEALLKLDRDELKAIIRGEHHGGQVFVYRFIK
jgi:hypothetical protein